MPLTIVGVQYDVKLEPQINIKNVFPTYEFPL